MTRYKNMTEAELDGLIILSFYPKKKEKLNLSNKEIFIHLIIKKLEDADLLSEFGENVISFFNIEIEKKKVIGVLIYEAFLADIKVFKMAALKTFDENKECIK
jgi:hypothetical protein